jgi:hypothetical protein
MTDTQETTETAEPKGMSDDAFMAQWSEMYPDPEAPQESVAKSDTSSGHAAPDALQGGSEETPAPLDPVKLADAMDEIKRAGLEPNAFKGKSEGELIALGVELNTRRRQRDREWQEAQGQSSETKATGEHSSATGPAETKAKATPESKAAPLIDLEKELTPVFEDLSEEAAQSLKSVLGSIVSQNAALQARLDQEDQARQLAPIVKAADTALAGLGLAPEVLSNPDKRESLLGLASQIRQQNPEAFDGMSIEESVTKAVHMAAQAVYGVTPKQTGQAQATKVRTGTPATARGKAAPDKPRNRDERFDELSTQFFRENFPEHL